MTIDRISLYTLVSANWFSTWRLRSNLFLLLLDILRYQCGEEMLRVIIALIFISKSLGIVIS